MKTNQPDQGNRSGVSARKPYTKPHIRRVGAVRDIIMSGSSGSGDSNGPTTMMPTKGGEPYLPKP